MYYLLADNGSQFQLISMMVGSRSTGAFDCINGRNGIYIYIYTAYVFGGYGSKLYIIVTYETVRRRKKDEKRMEAQGGNASQ